MYADKSVRYYLNSLSSKAPAPGGGSASAMFGALGCALLSMVCNITLSAKGINGYKLRAKNALKKSEALRKKMILLIDKDAQCYQRFSAAFKKYKNDQAKLQKPIKQAVTPSLGICDLSYKAAMVCHELSFIGSKSVLSDVMAAMHSLDAAFEASFINIRINLKYISDKNYIIEKSRTYTSIQKDLKSVKAKVLSKCRERMSA